MTGRVRRTRIYGANYNIGESYYKPTLDSLNRKQFGSKSPTIKDDFDILEKIPSHTLNSEFDLPKSALKRAVTEEPALFNYQKSSASLLNDDDIDEDVQNTLRKIRGLKKKNANFLEDSMLETAGERMRSLEIGRSLRPSLPLYDSDDETPVVRKVVSDILQSTSSANSASSRANATRERLANIESEMSERFDKQVQRESRSAHLKKFLSETGTETKVVKKVTF